MSGIELPTTTELTSRRRSNANSQNSEFSADGMLNGVLNGAGGDRTNHIFGASFVVLLCVILIFASSSMGGPVKPTQSIAYVGTMNLKAPEFHRQVQMRPENVSLVIVGDSISRYSYLSLVYFLRWGRWFDPGLSKSNLVNEGSFDNPFHEATFNEFYYQSNVMLQPYELCDCHKNAEHPNMRKYTYENRYYHDPKHNNTVTFLHAFGDELPSHGRLTATDTYTDKWKWSTKEKGLMNPGWDKPTWSHETWPELITEYVAKIQPKPAFTALQAGQFHNHFGPETGAQQAKDIRAALKEEDIIGYWRTTNYNKTHQLEKSWEKLDAYMCNLLDNCLDISWTKNVKTEQYWDTHHFYEPVYRVMNEDMLEVMGYLPEDYVKYNISLLLD